MDPNANLEEQLRLARQFIERADRGRAERFHSGDTLRLAELVQALDEWIVKGGFLPARWQRPAPRREHEFFVDDGEDTL